MLEAFGQVLDLHFQIPFLTISISLYHFLLGLLFIIYLIGWEGYCNSWRRAFGIFPADFVPLMDWPLGLTLDGKSKLIKKLSNMNGQELVRPLYWLLVNIGWIFVLFYGLKWGIEKKLQLYLIQKKLALSFRQKIRLLGFFYLGLWTMALQFLGFFMVLLGLGTEGSALFMDEFFTASFGRLLIITEQYITLGFALVQWYLLAKLSKM